MLAQDIPFYRDRTYISAALTHFAVDILNNSRNLVFAVLALSLGLRDSQLAFVALLYSVGNALTQPAFGWVADRFGPRWLMVGGMGWMIFFFSIGALAPDAMSLTSLTIASLGSGAFHPTGTMIAARTTQAQKTQATAFFFMSGQLGLFLGPVLAGILLDDWGRPGFILLPILALIPLLMNWAWVPNSTPIHHGHVPKSSIEAKVRSAPTSPRWRKILPLIIIILFMNTVSISILTFSPKLFTEMGFSASHVGWLAGLFMLGSAMGGIVGGNIADRYRGQWAILIGLTLGVLPTFLYIPSAGLLQFGMLFLAGFFVGMPHSVLVVRAQSLLPGRQALASGLTLGLMFFGGQLGSYFVGLFADQLGLEITLQRTAFLLLVAVVAALFAPD